MNIDRKQLIERFSPSLSRSMLIHQESLSLGRSAENATQVQQQLQTILITNTALGSGVIYAIAAKASN
ncbi:RebB family R body protein [Celerinatantimonas sp. YJH-8]|uniref:RebB family R body protein n=1 Tax=Celerinatantimonas sp. YJH-8 TaxID=3228714 RepID=UPI0038C85D22